jgi:hypothetical protein
VTTLGFSAAQAAPKFSRAYQSTLQYEDGSTTGIAIEVASTGAPMTGMYTGDVAAVAGNALFFQVTVDVTTEDGRFDEHFTQDLKVLTLSAARAQWRLSGNMIAGSHTVPVPPRRPNEDEFIGSVTFDANLGSDGHSEGRITDTRLEDPTDDAGDHTDGEVGEWR